ncbi:MAG TPA: ATP-binding protein [Anaerolineales bacterium]|nr:ATP-binding protein [Anaerolineales bacterium]
MNFIQNLFSINHEIIYFIYGLVFFVLGLAITLQSRHSSRLDLARNLTWLAAFGFLHGFNEWGDLFIPIQAAYLSPKIITVLNYVHLLLLASSFACLFEFGAALLESLKPQKWLHILAASLFSAWGIIVFLPLHQEISDFTTWFNTSGALARYFIGLPGGLLAAYALRKHTLQRIAPFNVPQIVRAMQAAGITMALYALAAGLIVAPVNFFPGNWVNTDTFTHYLIVPPQLIRALLGLVMAATTIRVLEIFDVETSRQIESMKEQQMLADERERIARELHDGTIQKVYTAGLLVRSAQNLAEAETPLAGRLATAVGVLDDAIGDLRQNLSELHTPLQSDEPLRSKLEKLVNDPRFRSLVDVTLDLDLPGSDTLPPERCAHVLAIVQETLSNIIRHARARHVTVSASRRGKNLQLAIQDDGIGIPADNTEGHGLRNMRDRAALLHGRLGIEKLEKGTRMTLDIPWRVEQ